MLTLLLVRMGRKRLSQVASPEVVMRNRVNRNLGVLTATLLSLLLLTLAQQGTIVDAGASLSPPVDEGPPIPILVLDYRFDGMVVNSVVTGGPYAYVAGGMDGLSVIDYTDPEGCVVGHLDVPANDITLVGDRAYLLGPDGFRIVDVSLPKKPAQVGFYGADEPSLLTSDGSHVYLAFNEGVQRIEIINVAEQAIPTLVSEGYWLEGSERYTDLEVANDVLFFGESENTWSHWGPDEVLQGGLWRLDVTDPANPTVIAMGYSDAVDGVALRAGLAAVGLSECQSYCIDHWCYDGEWQCRDYVRIYDATDPAYLNARFTDRVGYRSGWCIPGDCGRYFIYENNLPFFVGRYVLFEKGPIVDVADEENMYVVGKAPPKLRGGTSDSDRVFTECDGLCIYRLVDASHWAFTPFVRLD